MVPEGLAVSHKQMIAWKQRGVKLAGTPFQTYRNKATLPTIQEGTDALHNVRARIKDEPMPSLATELMDIPVNMSSLSRVYAQIGTNTGRSYGAVVVNI